MPQIETDTLLGDLKKFRVAKSDLTQCFVCMHPSPHSMRVQRLACACKACAKVTTTAVCPHRARRFHLLAVFIVSQQQREQHTEVLHLLRQVFSAVVGKPLKVRYVMGDADAAQWNAVEEVFGEDCEYIYLMCYFHVAKKVFEKTRSMVAASAASVMADIHDLHFTTSEAVFHENLAEVQERWAKSKDLSVFSKYFSKVWLNQRFWRW
ncbi:hypothetical protein PI124_g12003 [Phytophthora idaei]|nr:hypothetical protein PI126_g8141 [Phytophthora idaei]KAG3243186.1 hypothetical protein PI124_g12003 [Phytophthora idaei]